MYMFYQILQTKKWFRNGFGYFNPFPRPLEESSIANQIIAIDYCTRADSAKWNYVPLTFGVFTGVGGGLGDISTTWSDSKGVVGETTWLTGVDGVDGKFPHSFDGVLETSVFCGWPGVTGFVNFNILPCLLMATCGELFCKFLTCSVLSGKFKPELFLQVLSEGSRSFKSMVLEGIGGLVLSEWSFIGFICPCWQGLCWLVGSICVLVGVAWFDKTAFGSMIISLVLLTVSKKMQAAK